MERAWQGRAGCSPVDIPDMALPDPRADVLGLVATRLTGNTQKETTETTVQTNSDVAKKRLTPTCRATGIFAIAGQIRSVKNPTK